MSLSFSGSDDDSIQVENLDPNVFFEVESGSDDRQVWERQCRDEAIEMAASGATRQQVIDVLQRQYLADGNTIERWISDAYAVAAREADAATRHAARALGARNVLEPPTALSLAEVIAARETPTCFVEGLLYADVRLLVGAGAAGKSTALIYEAAALAGGAETIWGHRILRHGPVVYVTGEDTREMNAARVRRVIEDNGMAGRAQTIVANFLVVDASDGQLRMTVIDRDSVVPGPGVEWLISRLETIKPVAVVIDPLMSFGVGESRVNDAEQGFIMAARQIRNELGCNVTLVHHTGKSNARERADDQYAFRGGSALADGARMVHNLTPVDAPAWRKATGGGTLAAGATGLRLTIAKSTYTRRPPDVLIERHGFAFRVAGGAVARSADPAANHAAEVLALLHAEVAAGRFPTANAIHASGLTLMTRAALTKALDRLEYDGAVERRPIPNRRGRGGAREYIHPLGDAPPMTPPPDRQTETAFADPLFGVRLGSETATQLKQLPFPETVAASKTPMNGNGAPKHQTEGGAS